MISYISLRHLAAVVLYSGRILRFLERSLRTKKQLTITANVNRDLIVLELKKNLL